MQANKPAIFRLGEFGLSLGQLTSLGSVKIKLHVYLRHINEKSLFKFKPSQRLEKMKIHYGELFERVKRNWSDGPLNISLIRQQPRGFGASVEARHVSRVLRMPEIDSIWIDEIPGRERASTKPKVRWFAVKARFAIQVEAQTTGLQSYEDRIVIVKAMDFEDAKNKLQPQFQQYGTPYLNANGLMVRWVCERIVDSYEIGDEKIDPHGTEVFQFWLGGA